MNDRKRAEIERPAVDELLIWLPAMRLKFGRNLRRDSRSAWAPDGNVALKFGWADLSEIGVKSSETPKIGGTGLEFRRLNMSETPSKSSENR